MRSAYLISNRQHREAVCTLVKAVGVSRSAIGISCRLQGPVGSVFRHSYYRRTSYEKEERDRWG
jgi:hypothetical protein